MDIVIPVELTGATQRQAGLQMSQAIQSFADVSRQTTEQVNNTNAYIEALDHENKMTQIYDGAKEELRNLSYEDILKRKKEGTDPYSLANTQAADYLNGIQNLKVKQYAAQKMSYIQYKMDQHANAIEEHKRVTAGQAALDEAMKNETDIAAYGYVYDPNIRPTDRQLKMAENEKAQGMSGAWVNDVNELNNIERMDHYNRKLMDIQGKITGAVTSGIISHQQAQAMDQQARINIAMAIAGNNVKEANLFFDRQQKEMTPIDFARGKQALHAFIKEKSTTDAVQSLQDEFRLNEPDGDWAGAVKKIFDHKNWADYGISSAEDAIRVMGLLTHSVSAMVQTVKLQEQHQIDSIWETQVAPLLKRGNLSQVNKVIDGASISDAAKASAKLDAKRFLDAMKRGSGGEGGAESIYFNPADVPDQIYNNKKLAKHTAQMLHTLSTRVNPKEYGAAWDTAMSELQGLAAKKDKAGEKVTISDIDYLFGTITTNPKFLKNAKRNLGDVLGGGGKNVPTAIPTTPDGKPIRTPVRIPGENVSSFNRRAGVIPKSAYGVDISGNPFMPDNPFGR